MCGPGRQQPCHCTSGAPLRPWSLCNCAWGPGPKVGAAGAPPCAPLLSADPHFCSSSLQQVDKWVREEDPFPWEEKEEKAIARWAASCSGPGGRLFAVAAADPILPGRHALAEPRMRFGLLLPLVARPHTPSTRPISASVRPLPAQVHRLLPLLGSSPQRNASGPLWQRNHGALCHAVLWLCLATVVALCSIATLCRKCVWAAGRAAKASAKAWTDRHCGKCRRPLAAAHRAR